MLQPTTPHLLIFLLLLFEGCVRSMQFTSLNAITYAEIEPHQLSQASSFSNVTQQLAIGLGVTIGGLALQLSHQLQAHATIVSTDFWPVFLLLSLIAATALPFALKLPPDAGIELSGQR